MGKYNIKWIIGLCCLALIFTYSCRVRYKQGGENFAFTQSQSAVDHGRDLVYNSCSGCHLNRADNKLIGNRFSDVPKIMGKVYSANLTDSKMYGVLRLYTNQQLAYLIKTGINREGEFIPYMVRPNMADDDVSDIIVYLRSGEPPVAAGDTSVGHTHLNLIGRAAIHTKKPQPDIKGIVRPSTDNAIADGRYLVDITGCFHCHSKSVVSLNYLHPEESKRYMQGGAKFKNPKGGKIKGPNLTPDKKTGIGEYTKEDFRKAVKEGVAPHGVKLRPPMDKFTHLTDQEVDNIFAYLQTLPPKSRK